MACMRISLRMYMYMDMHTCMYMCMVYVRVCLYVYVHMSVHVWASSFIMPHAYAMYTLRVFLDPCTALVGFQGFLSGVVGLSRYLLRPLGLVSTPSMGFGT